MMITGGGYFASYFVFGELTAIEVETPYRSTRTVAYLAGLRSSATGRFVWRSTGTISVELS